MGKWEHFWRSGKIKKKNADRKEGTLLCSGKIKKKNAGRVENTLSVLQ